MPMRNEMYQHIMNNVKQDQNLHSRQLVAQIRLPGHLGTNKGMEAKKNMQKYH